MSAKPTVNLSQLIRDVHTEIVVNTYLDRILILITQLGKVGNLIQASIPPTVTQLALSDQDYGADIADSTLETSVSNDAGAEFPQPSPAIQLTNLFGIAPNEHIQTLHSLYASYVATLTWISEEAHGQQRVPVIVGVALKKVTKEEERPVFLEIMKNIKHLLATRYSDGN